MLVRMLTRIGGFRNGEPWPEKGETVDVPPHEASDLIAAGYAKEATSETPADDNVEATTGGSDETPADEDEEAKPLGEMTAKELVEFGAGFGLELSVKSKKDVLIAAITEALETED